MLTGSQKENDEAKEPQDEAKEGDTAHSSQQSPEENISRSNRLPSEFPQSRNIGTGAVNLSLPTSAEGPAWRKADLARAHENLLYSVQQRMKSDREAEIKGWYPTRRKITLKATELRLGESPKTKTSLIGLHSRWKRKYQMSCVLLLVLPGSTTTVLSKATFPPISGRAYRVPVTTTSQASAP
jgi:hypothetical protein